MPDEDPDARMKADLVMETMNEIAREKTSMAVVHAYMHMASHAIHTAINTIYAELEAEGEPTEVCGVLSGYWNEFARAMMHFHLEVPCNHEEPPNGDTLGQDHCND
jgi:ABC-type histidine transport system ATPase subunit